MEVIARNKEEAIDALTQAGKENLEDICVQVLMPVMKHKVLESDADWDDLVYFAGEKTIYDFADGIDGKVEDMPVIEPMTIEQAKEKLVEIGKEVGEDVLLEGLLPFIKHKQAESSSSATKLIYAALEKPIYELCDKLNPND